MGTAVGSCPIPVAYELAGRGGFRFWWPQVPGTRPGLRVEGPCIRAPERGSLNV
jgi:hypothetical protein